MTTFNEKTSQLRYMAHLWANMVIKDMMNVLCDYNLYDISAVVTSSACQHVSYR